jgi:Bifunctional DNA primase/polymerase, N-terminal
MSFSTGSNPKATPYQHYGEHDHFANIDEEIVVWLRPLTERLCLAVRAAIRTFEESGKMRDAAMAYAAHGFAIFPLSVVSKKPIPPRDKDADGKPIPGTGGVYKATCDPLIIRAWWRDHPRALIGMPMGPASGVWCLDVDTSEDHADGVAAWGELAAQHEPIVTREHRSATGGPHLIFNWDRERPLGCSNGALPDGLSVKGAVATLPCLLRGVRGGLTPSSATSIRLPRRSGCSNRSCRGARAPMPVSKRSRPTSIDSRTSDRPLATSLVERVDKVDSVRCCTRSSRARWRASSASCCSYSRRYLAKGSGSSGKLMVLLGRAS